MNNHKNPQIFLGIAGVGSYIRRVFTVANGTSDGIDRVLIIFSSMHAKIDEIARVSNVQELGCNWVSDEMSELS